MCFGLLSLENSKIKEVIARNALSCSHACHTLQRRNQLEINRSRQKKVLANKVDGACYAASYGNHAV
jgi:hypothetical protein